jgi:hypothetical protein
MSFLSAISMMRNMYLSNAFRFSVPEVDRLRAKARWPESHTGLLLAAATPLRDQLSLPHEADQALPLRRPCPLAEMDPSREAT